MNVSDLFLVVLILQFSSGILLDVQPRFLPGPVLLRAVASRIQAVCIEFN